MKTAVCIHGLARGSTIKADGAYKEQFATLRNKIAGCDVFIHSWDIDISDELDELFQPVNSYYEKQKQFSDELNALYSNAKLGGMQLTKPHATSNIFNSLSFLYSRYQSIKLKQIYEKENRFVYDCVITARFDVGWHRGGSNLTSHLNFNNNADMNYVYQAWWNQTNAGASDHWFYSNSANIDILGDLYNQLPKYLAPDSKYTKQCQTGWPLSNSHDEFSNELDKLNDSKDISDDLATYTRDNIIHVNNHCLYKHHMMEHNLWISKSKFLNKELWK